MNRYYLSNKNDYMSKYGEISSGYFELNKSKFYSYIFNINDIKEADKYIKLIKSSNKKARHVIYCYKLDNNVLKFSNDGEPRGSGINSVITMLEREEVTNVLVVIVRYFGGSLLGSSRLFRCYLNSFKEAYIKLDKTSLEDK